MKQNTINHCQRAEFQLRGFHVLISFCDEQIKVKKQTQNWYLDITWPEVTFTCTNVWVKLFNIPQTQETPGSNMLPGKTRLQLVFWLMVSVSPVVVVGLLEHLLAGYFCFKFGADEEGATHLSVEWVRFLGRRRQSLLQHHGDEFVDALGGALTSKVKGNLGREGLAEYHHCIHVGVLHRLNTGH